MKARRKQAWGPFWKLIKDTRLPYFQILLCVAAGLGVSQLNLMFPSYTEQIMAGDFSARIIVATILVLFGGVIMDMVYQVICQIVNGNISRKFRDSVWKKMLKLPMGFFNQNGTSELISRQTEDTAQLSNFLTDDIAGIVSNIYTLIATIVILLGYDWHLVAAELIIVPIIIVIGIIKGRVDFSLNNSLQLKVALLTGGIAELLTNVPLIKVFVQEEKATKKSEEMTEALFQTKMKITWIGNAFSAISTVLEVVESLIVILFGIYLIRNDYITVSVWVAFYLYSTNLTGCVDTLMQVWDDLKVAQGAMKRISEISAEEEEDYEKGEKLSFIDEDIHLENLSFSYEEKKVLDQVSFDIKKGGHTAIVGLSGAGKTTILNLLERFYKPDEGRIRMGEKEIDDFSLKSWRDRIGYVTQDAWIMEGSVRENLTYALEEKISDEALMEKLKDLGLASLIEELSEGLDTQAGEEGSMLSGGQRQRICVARTLLKEPEFLLLDEVTANLDALTEQSITSALKKKKGQQTLVSIAHKLNTVVDADQIIVMEKGKVNSIGTHASLMAEKGLYYDMYQKQTGEGGEMA
jgi:ATP-binding cassette, subfamily B, bacterial AbcA/BmrA